MKSSSRISSFVRILNFTMVAANNYHNKKIIICLIYRYRYVYYNLPFYLLQLTSDKVCFFLTKIKNAIFFRIKV